jgi:hypothetical protein
MAMIKLDTDEAISDADYELIAAFTDALIDKDHYAMHEVMDIVNDRMVGECVCLENECVCGSW